MKTKSSSRILARLLVVAMIVCSIAALPVVSFADEYSTTATASGNWTNGGSGTYELYESTTTTGKYKLVINGTGNYNQNVKIDSDSDGSADDINVSAAPWHEYAANIKEIVFGEGITYISYNTFKGDGGVNGVAYSSLTAITLPDSLTSIDHYAFQKAKITTITGGRNVKNLGNFVFDGATLTTIENFENIETIGQSVFSGLNCSTVTFPASIKSIAAIPFGYINANVKVVDFSKATNTLTFGSPLSGAVLGALHGLTTVYLPVSFEWPKDTEGSNVTIYSGHTSHGNENWRIPENTKLIIPYEWDSTKLESFYSTFNSISHQTKNGDGWASTKPVVEQNKYPVDVKNGVIKIGTEECKYTLKPNGTTPETYTLNIYGEGALAVQNTKPGWGDYTASITKIVFNEGITELQQQMFAGTNKWANGDGATYSPYTALTEVVFPQSMETIGTSGSVFDGAPLTTTNLATSNIVTIDNNCFARTALSGDIILPNTIKKLGVQAFASCTNIERVFFENGASNVEFGNSVFHECPLVYVQIPEGSTRASAAADGNGIFSGARTNVVFDFMGEIPGFFKTATIGDNIENNLFGADQATTMAAIAVTQPGVDIAAEDWAVMDASLGFGVNLEGTASLAIVEKVENVAAGEAVVINDSNAAKTYTAIYAAYDADGILVDAFVQSGTVGAFAKETITASDVTEATTYKWFIWDGLTALKPYKAR